MINRLAALVGVGLLIVGYLLWQSPTERDRQEKTRGQEIVLPAKADCNIRGVEYFNDYIENQATVEGWSGEYHFSSQLNTCLASISNQPFMSDFSDTRVFDVYENKIILYSSLYKNEPVSQTGPNGLENLSKEKFDMQKNALFTD